MISKLILYGVLAMAPFQAMAALEFCNKTESKVDLALLQKTDGNWQTSGWYVVNAGQCGYVIEHDLTEPNYYWYAVHSNRTWSGTSASDKLGCIRRGAKFQEVSDNNTCPAGFRPVRFKKLHVGDNIYDYVDIETEASTLAQPSEGPWTATSVSPLIPPSNDLYVPIPAPAPAPSAGPPTVAASPNAPDFLDVTKACEVLHAQLERPRLRTVRVNIAHYTDLLTIPQTKTECTNVYDTGVPDPATCTVVWDNCASRIDLLFGGWTCVPGSTTSCDTIKTCNAWASYKKTMECDLQVQLKLPDFIEAPLSRFIDQSYDVIEQTRQQVRAALPMACVPPGVRNAAQTDPTQAIAKEITRIVQNRLQAAIEKEAREWVARTGVQVVVASIPTGGIGGAAMMSTKVGEFVYRAHQVIKPIVDFGNEAKGLAEDLGFSTSCGWNDWHSF